MYVRTFNRTDTVFLGQEEDLQPNIDPVSVL